MTRFEDEFDNDVRSVLRQDHGRDMTESDEMTISQLQSMVFANLRGKSRWLTIVTFAKMLTFIGGAVFAGFRFFQVDDVQSWIGYATLFTFCTLGVAMMSVTYWTFMTRNSLVKVIKHLEMQVAHLTDRLKANDAA